MTVYKVTMSGAAVVAYLLCVPFTDILAIHRWLPLPMLVLLVLAAVYLFGRALRARAVYFPFEIEDVLLFVFLTMLCLSTFINIKWFDLYSVTHLFSYMAIIGSYYFALRFLLSGSGIPVRVVMQALSVGVVLVGIFGVYEFVVRNYVGNSEVVELPGRISDRGEYIAIHSEYFRARSFMAESGLMALYLELVAPVVIFFSIEARRWWLAAFLALTSLAGLGVTFSAAALASLAAGTLLALTVSIWGRPVRTVLSVLVLSITLLSLFLVKDELAPDGGALHTAVQKVLMRSDDPSTRNRLRRWGETYEGITDSPLIGNGVATFIAEEYSVNIGDGVVSFWLQVLFEGGILAFLPLLAAYVLVIWRAVRLSALRKYGYLISLGAGFVHYAVISDYWKPWLWLVLAIVIYDTSQESRRTGALKAEDGV